MVVPKRKKHSPAKLPKADPPLPLSVRKMVIASFSVISLLLCIFLVLSYLYQTAGTETPPGGGFGSEFTRYMKEIFKLWIDRDKAA